MYFNLTSISVAADSCACHVCYHTSLVQSLSFIFNFRPKARSASSIILRGANDFMLDEMERSMHDAICVVKRVLESKTVVPGGGAVEAALSIYLENFATSLVSKSLAYEKLHTQTSCKLNLAPQKFFKRSRKKSKFRVFKKSSLY